MWDLFLWNLSKFICEQSCLCLFRCKRRDWFKDNIEMNEWVMIMKKKDRKVILFSSYWSMLVIKWTEMRINFLKFPICRHLIIIKSWREWSRWSIIHPSSWLKFLSEVKNRLNSQFCPPLSVSIYPP